MREPILKVDDLSVSFSGNGPFLPALDGVHFKIHAGETLALVGESGSGKTITSLALLDLLGSARRKGHAQLEGVGDLLTLPPRKMQNVRGGEIAMIFQEPMTSLNPVRTAGAQITEAIRLHTDLSKRGAKDRAREMMELVQMPDPVRQLDSYPHQLSGGMRQRVMIAMALSCSPRLLIADEPTTALDVTVQAQILQLLRKLQRDLNMAMLFVTHDLGVVNQIAHRVCVMYAGRIVEEGPVRDVLDAPGHPYTRGLIRSIPRGPRKLKLYALPGRVPSLADRGIGCHFAPRCAHAVPGPCTDVAPAMERIGASSVRCARWSEIPAFTDEVQDVA